MDSTARTDMDIRRMDTPANRTFWESVARIKDEWQHSAPAWYRDLHPEEFAGYEPAIVRQCPRCKGSGLVTVR